MILLGSSWTLEAQIGYDNENYTHISSIQGSMADLRHSFDRVFLVRGRRREHRQVG